MHTHQVNKCVSPLLPPKVPVLVHLPPIQGGGWASRVCAYCRKHTSFLKSCLLCMESLEDRGCFSDPQMASAKLTDHLQWIRKLPSLFKHSYQKGTFCSFFLLLKIANGSLYISHPVPGGTHWLLMEFMVFTSCCLCGKKGKRGSPEERAIPVPAWLIVPIFLSKKGTNTWLWGAQYFWKQ